MFGLPNPGTISTIANGKKYTREHIIQNQKWYNVRVMRGAIRHLLSRISQGDGNAAQRCLHLLELELVNKLGIFNPKITLFTESNFVSEVVKEYGFMFFDNQIVSNFAAGISGEKENNFVLEIEQATRLVKSMLKAGFKTKKIYLLAIRISCKTIRKLHEKYGKEINIITLDLTE